MDLAGVWLMVSKGVEVFSHPIARVSSNFGKPSCMPPQATMLPMPHSISKLHLAIVPRARTDTKESDETLFAHVNALHPKAVKCVGLFMPRTQKESQEVIVALLLIQNVVSHVFLVKLEGILQDGPL